MNSARPITILMADDDPEDRMLAQEALEQSRLANDLYFVEDGRAADGLPPSPKRLRGRG